MRMLSPQSKTTWSWPTRSTPTFFDDFDRLVDSFLQPTHADTVNFQPACDINETKDHYLVTFDMPGVRKEDLKIEVADNQLMISGERHRELKSDEKESWIRHERNYGRFQRIFSLPNSVNAEKIEAHCQDGVLEVMLPKAEAAKGRTIEIQSGKGGFFNKLLGDKKEVKEVKSS